MRGITKFAILVFLANFAAPTLASPAQAKEKGWIELKSDHFIIYSNATEARARGLLSDLEYFRYFLQFVTTVEVTEGPLPLVVYAFRNFSSYRSVVRSKGTVGHYRYYTTDRPKAYAEIQLKKSRQAMNGRDILFHEYVHHFLSQFSPYRYPRWYDEGFAEYLSSFTYEDGVVSVGKLAEHRLWALANESWLPLERLFGTNREYLKGPGSDIFYAQSWLTVHYLQSKPKLKDSLKSYLVLLNKGVPYLEAYDSSFSMSRRELVSESKKYLFGRKLPYTTYSFSEINFKPAISVRRLSREEAELLVLDVKLDHRPAKDHLKKIGRPLKKLAERWPSDPRPLFALANEEFDHGDATAARAIVSDALREFPDHPEGLSTLAYFEFRKIDEIEDPVAKNEQSEKVRLAIRQALAADPQNLRMLYYMARLGNVQNIDRGRLLESLKAARDARLLSPSNEFLEILFAELVLKVGYPDEARQIYGDLAYWARSESVGNLAKKRLDEIEQDDSE